MDSEENCAISALPPLRDVIRDHGLRAEKSLGQNFLLDLNLTRKIARTAQAIKGATVFEIGPGPGGLTRGLLLEGAAKVIAIEYDARAITALDGLANAAGGKLRLVQQDALRADLPALAGEEGFAPPYIIAANLPYNIATPLLVGWLFQLHENPALYSEMVLMFQKEVAQRIVAKPSTKAYGRLSVLCQWLCDVKTAFDVPAAAFTPPPKVTSSIVRLAPRTREDAPFESVEKLTAMAFGQRRKMIRGSLKPYMEQIEICGLDPKARAEDLPPRDYVRLAAEISKARL